MRRRPTWALRYAISAEGKDDVRMDPKLQGLGGRSDERDRLPKVGDIMEVVDMLKVSPVVLEAEACSRSTNRNSECDRCAQACIADAIRLSKGEVEISVEACVNCGCCVPVCPTDALMMAEPDRATVQKRAFKIADPASGSAVFACSRIASKNQGDPDRFAEVPCLGHIGEGQLVELASCGFDDIMLIDGDCETCKLGKASSRVDETLAIAGKIVDACGAEAVFTRQSSFPKEYLVDAKDARGEGRRGIFRQTGSYFKTVAGNVAKKTLEEKMQEAGISVESPKSSGLKAGKGVMNLEPTANYSLIEDMEKMGACPSPEELDTRHFGNVYIDFENCSGCGMCVLFCPTKALRYAEYDTPDNQDARYCEFSASDCLQCMLCSDVCLRDCLELSPKVTLEELLDFEPRLIEMRRPQKTMGLGALSKRSRTR